MDNARAQSANDARQLRDEVSATLGRISVAIRETMGELASTQQVQLESFANQLTSFAKINSDKLDSARTDSATSATQLRQEVITTLKNISDSMTTSLRELTTAQSLQLEKFSRQIEALTTTIADKLETVRATVDGELKSMKSDNAAQLEQMRQTVDEKLQGTLEKRLGESFQQVSERLELVHKGLGEMQSLATGVGDLKKVLTNVKTRGTWGEVQLGALLEQVLSPEQFAANVSTK